MLRLSMWITLYDQLRGLLSNHAKDCQNGKNDDFIKDASVDPYLV